MLRQVGNVICCCLWFSVLEHGNVFFCLCGWKGREGVEHYTWHKRALQQSEPSPGWWSCVCSKEFVGSRHIVKSRVPAESPCQSRGRGWWLGQQGTGAPVCWGQVAALALRRPCWKRLQQGQQGWYSSHCHCFHCTEFNPNREVMVSSDMNINFLDLFVFLSVECNMYEDRDGITGAKHNHPCFVVFSISTRMWFLFCWINKGCKLGKWMFWQLTLTLRLIGSFDWKQKKQLGSQFCVWNCSYLPLIP